MKVFKLSGTHYFLSELYESVKEAIIGSWMHQKATSAGALSNRMWLVPVAVSVPTANQSSRGLLTSSFASSPDGGRSPV